jgi:antitoxin component of RelBE/YafQ-DinJ toxin-antitoxin module
MARMNQANINFGDLQLRQIKKHAERMGLDRSEFVRLAVARLVEEEEMRLTMMQQAHLHLRLQTKSE